MIKVAICDDEPEWINTAQDIVNNFFKEKSIEFSIETFDNANLILTEMEHNVSFNILILDIEMPDINGFEIAEKNKKQFPDMLLMFYTAHEQYVFDAFKFQPFRYIRKEHSAREFNPALFAATQIIEASADRFMELKNADKTYNVKISEIKYFETNKRRCDVYINDGSVINVRKTIKELYNETGSENFILVHSGAAVNVRYITCFSNSDVTLEGGKKLPVSRTRLKAVKAAISDYWRKRI